MGRSGRNCSLCGNGTRHQRQVPVATCARCRKAVCVHHGSVLEAEIVCNRCLRFEPADVRKSAFSIFR